MTSIDPRSPLAAALQAQLASVRDRARVQHRSKAAASDESTRTRTSLAQRVGAIGRDDPERRRKAVRLYLESELAREFGSALLNDPALPQMLDAVQQRML
ncbi:MAG TPA: hypothetical protein VGD76_18505, partial [Ramlibacter sp.]